MKISCFISDSEALPWRSGDFSAEIDVRSKQKKYVQAHFAVCRRVWIAPFSLNSWVSNPAVLCPFYKMTLRRNEMRTRKQHLASKSRRALHFLELSIVANPLSGSAPIANKPLLHLTSSRLIRLAKAHHENVAPRKRPSNVPQAGLMSIDMQGVHPCHPPRSSQSIAIRGKRARSGRRSK